MSMQQSNEQELLERYKKYKKKSQFVTIWKRYRKNKLGVVALIVFLAMLILVVSADLYIDYDTQVAEHNLSIRYQAPSKEHPLGTDQYGRDELIRIIYGGRISMFVGIATVVFSLVFGSLIGASAAYFGGKVDNILMRIIDVVLAIPSTLLAITLIAAMGSSLFNLILAMGISQLPRMARLVRSSVLSVTNMDYVEAARSCGTGDFRIIFRHILPNAIGPILVQTTQTVARAVLVISSLSFVGLGISEPTPEWGSMLSVARAKMRLYPNLAVAPGLAIVLVCMSLTIIGDTLRDALDPRLKN